MQGFDLQIFKRFLGVLLPDPQGGRGPLLQHLYKRKSRGDALTRRTSPIRIWSKDANANCLPRICQVSKFEGPIACIQCSKN